MSRRKFDIPEPIERAFRERRLSAMYRGHNPGKLYPRKVATQIQWICWCTKCSQSMTFLELPTQPKPEVGGEMVTTECY